MIYCVSDIHGEADRLRQMLSLIQFSEDDTLYILGDVADRNPGGVALWTLIMDTPNMVLLLGNHEQMCLDTMSLNSTPEFRSRWRRNGGDVTYRELMYTCTPETRHGILQFLSSCPDCLDLEVNGQKFHLVHGHPGEDHHTRIWGRIAPSDPPYFQDKLTIVGHTPTCVLTGDYDRPFQIWHGNGVIDIDCGCGHGLETGRLGCLRLEDRAEFYV